jgi:hypothetical protein
LSVRSSEVPSSPLGDVQRDRCFDAEAIRASGFNNQHAEPPPTGSSPGDITTNIFTGVCDLRVAAWGPSDVRCRDTLPIR